MKNLSVAQKYMLGMALWMGLYAVVLVCVIKTLNAQQPEGVLLYVLTVLPALPIGGSLWVVLRYISKADEYVSAVLSRNLVMTTGILLFLTTVWGFLESWASVPHFPLMWVFPVFWMIFIVVQFANKFLFCGADQ